MFDERPSKAHPPEVSESNLSEHQFAIEQLRSEQSLIGGILAGLLGSVIGAGVWAAVTLGTGYQIGWMAVGVGILVGFSVRFAGKGMDRIFGVIGAIAALLGCAAGNFLTICGMVARQEDMPFVEVLSHFTPSEISELMVATFNPMDILFYGIALYEGYKLSFRRVSPQELNDLRSG